MIRQGGPLELHLLFNETAEFEIDDFLNAICKHFLNLKPVNLKNV